MSVVRILPRDAEALVDAYARTATLLTDTISRLSPLVTEANSLLTPPMRPAHGVIHELSEVMAGCSRDERDLAWRVEWIQTHDHLNTPDGTRNLFDLIAQAELEADMFSFNPDDPNLPTPTPLQEADWALHQIRSILDTAKFDAERGGIGMTVADGIWSTEDLHVIIENEHGYYTQSQVAHAQTVLTMATSSPEARDHLGITQSGDGWGWDDIGHITLDVLGMVPVVGNAADGINATWYAAEGQWLDAALSSMALIPVVGQAVTLARANVRAALALVPFNSLDEALVAVRQFLENAGILRRSTDDGLQVADDGLAALSATRIVPGGGLAAHEAAGGHAIARHVGKTPEELAARLDAQPGIQGASTFTDMSTAETAIAETLHRNDAQIRSFLSEAAPGDKLGFESALETSVGLVHSRNATQAVAGSTARVVIVADAAMPDGYLVLTAYPKI